MLHHLKCESLGKKKKKKIVHKLPCSKMLLAKALFLKKLTSVFLLKSYPVTLFCHASHAMSINCRFKSMKNSVPQIQNIPLKEHLVHGIVVQLLYSAVLEPFCSTQLA